MNKIIKNCLFTGDQNFMPELHSKQPEFTYSACGLFTKLRERIQKLTERGSLKHLQRNKLGKACFAHDTAYSNGKSLAKRTISDKILNNSAHETTTNRGYDGYQTALASMGQNFLCKKTGSGEISTGKARVSVNEQLAE